MQRESAKRTRSVKGSLHHLSHRLQLSSAGVGVAEHGLEVMAALIERPREHQLALKQTMAGLLRPLLRRLSIEPLGGEGQQVQRAAALLQR